MSRRTTIRIPDDVYTLLAERAKAEQRTVSNLVILLLKKSLSVAANVAVEPGKADPAHPNVE